MTATGPVIVRIEPAGVDLEVAEAETVAEAAWRQGYTWPTTCWGQADCMVCAVQLISGEERVEPPDSEELSQMQALLTLADWPITRLACRLKVTGSGVVLEKKGVRAPDVDGDGDGDGDGVAAQGYARTTTTEPAGR